eukprot:TRINITY_DN6493_c0_g2_i1.p1 TRINITY_DN6493_c0_g2~~TRINITY_DN6493_c0_g2_i1.p1  ORF type:complete len:960 (+),score=466.11 TRINITY_DN6493_c0_g2_i1:118-2997(+)
MNDDFFDFGGGGESPRGRPGGAAAKPAAKGRRAGVQPLLGGTGGGAKPAAKATKRYDLDAPSSDDDMDFGFLKSGGGKPAAGSSSPRQQPPQAAPPAAAEPPPPAAQQPQPAAAAAPVQQQLRPLGQKTLGGGAAAAAPAQPAASSEELIELKAAVARLEAEKKVLAGQVADAAQKEAQWQMQRDALQEKEKETYRLGMDKARLEEKNTQLERTKQDLAGEAEDVRRMNQRTTEVNVRLQQEADEADRLKEEVKAIREEHRKMEEELRMEQRKVSEFKQAMTNSAVLPYVPPPPLSNLSVDVPGDAPLTFQIRAMLHNATREIIEYQKAREEAMMQSLRVEQERFAEEIAEREKLRAVVERQELEKWRSREQEERLERERREIDERAVRAQRDAQERVDRERIYREEKANQLQEELAEREAMAKRMHTEHQQTIERITLGFTTTQEQMAHAHEHQLRSYRAQVEEERGHQRKVMTQQLGDLKAKYEHIISSQELQHKEALGSIAQFHESLSALKQAISALDLNQKEQGAMKRKFETAWEALKQERDATIGDREAILEELRTNVAEKHQQLDSERIMLSRLFSDFKVTIDNIKRQQEDERSRLTSSVAKAEKAREDYEREHRKWMRDCLRQKIDQDNDSTAAIGKVVDAVDDLKNERQGLMQERRDFERTREAHLRHVAELEEKVEEKKLKVESVLKEVQKKEEDIVLGGQQVQVQMTALHQRSEELVAEKEKLRDELYRVKDLGNLAFQKSKDLQKLRDEIRCAAELVEEKTAREERDKLKRLEDEKQKITLEKQELEKLRRDTAAETLAKRRQLLFQDAASTPAAVATRAPPPISAGDMRELLNQHNYLKYNVASAQPPPPITATPAHAATQPAPVAAVHVNPGGVPDPAAAAARPAAERVPGNETIDSLVGQQWVSLLRLSEEGSSEYSPGVTRPTPSSGTRASSYPTSTTPFTSSS